jgi:hypothetical protein
MWQLGADAGNSYVVCPGSLIPFVPIAFSVNGRGGNRGEQFLAAGQTLLIVNHHGHCTIKYQLVWGLQKNRI